MTPITILVFASSLLGSGIRFETNRGQTAAEVEYVSRGLGFTLFLTNRGDAILRVRGNDPKPLYGCGCSVHP